MSIVIPTFNERDNIGRLMTELRSLSPALSGPLDIILVDDNSPDGTAALATQLGARLGIDVRILSRNGRRSMGGAIVDGLRSCRWDLVCVMDADLSHPCSLVPELLRSLDGVDGVIASRYVDGSVIDSWTVSRRLVSLVATAVARLVLRIDYHDPLSGFFLVRRACLDTLRVTGAGNKPLLEILASGLGFTEIPYRFRGRLRGESKLDARSMLAFVRLVLRLRDYRVSSVRPSASRTHGILDGR